MNSALAGFLEPVARAIELVLVCGVSYGAVI